MNARLVIALCLPLLLWYVQVEGQPMVAVFKNVYDASTNLEETPSGTLEHAVGVAEVPVSMPETATFPETLAPASTPAFELEPATDSPIVSPSLFASPRPGKSESPRPGKSESPVPDVSASPTPGKTASPVPSPSSRFEGRISQGIAQCRKETRLPACSWRRGYIVSSQGLAVEEQISDNLCCCACHQVAECQAIHYERLEGKCVFHEGPIIRDQRQSGTKRWLK